ncbi:MAG: tRNA pseudouridine(38-40) synthase TruA, partial [Pseudomonadales bacterium]|nr:tRNA pseudouridine(38-40) synthase TruA [Pseudomonadales bacterium]
YTGTAYHGWQYQNATTPTVQLRLQQALSTIANEPVELICAGRTDTGVHATQQVVHFDTTAVRPSKAWTLGTNAHLPNDISVNWSQVVKPDFHARFSATARHYHYVILNQRVRSGLFPGAMTVDHRPLDAERMHQAAQALLGENDFSSFRAASCQSRTPMRFMERISVDRLGNLVVIRVRANAFLHHMVRNLAGVLMDIGAGNKPVSWAAELLELRDRSQGSVTAPPDGLYLVDVDYPQHFGIPEGPFLPHFFALLSESEVKPLS